MLTEYSRTTSESLAQISTAMAEIQNFFSKGLFLLAHPVDMLNRERIIAITVSDTYLCH